MMVEAVRICIFVEEPGIRSSAKALARNITEILEGKAGPSGKQSMLLLAVSGVVLVVVVVYSTIIARYVQLGMQQRTHP